MFERHVAGRDIASMRLSGAKLRSRVDPRIAGKVRGRRIEGARRIGKYLLVDLAGDLTLISHLGMSGRWLFYRDAPDETLTHVHVRVRFKDGSWLLFQDPRRFGLLRLVERDRVSDDPSIAILGPDPLASTLTGETMFGFARGAKVNVKNFLIDQRRIAGIGNIYASEILFRARVSPRRRAGTLTLGDWERVGEEIRAVLSEAVERMGTTFSTYRTLWNEPGTYGDELFVYDRAAEPCRKCRTPIRRIVQGQRSTFFCPTCQNGSSPRDRDRSRRATLDRSRNRRAARRLRAR